MKWTTKKPLWACVRPDGETLQAYIHAMNNRPVTDPLGTCQNCGEFAEFGHQC